MYSVNIETSIIPSLSTISLCGRTLNKNIRWRNNDVNETNYILYFIYTPNRWVIFQNTSYQSDIFFFLRCRSLHFFGGNRFEITELCNSFYHRITHQDHWQLSLEILLAVMCFGISFAADLIYTLANISQWTKFLGNLAN